MPSLAALNDEQIAGALTYVRREWGHTADPVDPKAVKDVRGATSGRRERGRSRSWRYSLSSALSLDRTGRADPDLVQRSRPRSPRTTTRSTQPALPEPKPVPLLTPEQELATFQLPKACASSSSPPSRWSSIRSSSPSTPTGGCGSRRCAGTCQT
jgi:hypothetical protein